MKKILLLLIIFNIFSCKTFFEKAAVDTNKSAEIRVKLTNLNEKIEITLKKHIKLINLTNNEEIQSIKKIIIEKNNENNKISINNAVLNDPFIIYSEKDRLIFINDKSYFGKIKIIPGKETFDIINIVPMETYLISVLPAEMPLSFNEEALKAQVIVARTYAYQHIARYKNRREFDVDDTVRYQVYSGYNFNFNLDLQIKLYNAVKSTKDLIVVYNDKPILSYFHANSGGYIRSGLDYFGNNSNFPYLPDHYDPFSLFYPGSDWEYTLKINDFLTLFNCNDSTITNESMILNETGFIESIKLNNKNFSSKTIRQTAGIKNIKSERFSADIDLISQEITFKGIGYGHGVGLSQWGAQGMAESGFNYKEIINFYYPNTQIKLYSPEINK
ncbi:MAG: SpoIID/LytB domain-containing protein [Spirochaetes bacterium]|nr:SpoIID/LytB domain-containing protein [Spirochaetota bacterium]